MSTNNKSVKTSSRPVRSLAILALTLVAMTGTAILQGSTSVKLGLDLRGGISVTLLPRTAPGEEGKITPVAIDEAVKIIRQRVNSRGVAESEVSAQGSGTNRQILISVPGAGDSGRSIVQLVGQVAELRFRQVIASASGLPVAPDPAALPIANVSAEINEKFAALDCTKLINLQGGGTDLPTDVIVTCDKKGSTKYILARADVVGRQISKASAGLEAQSGNVWSVSLTFNGEGTSAFGALTSRVVGLPDPTNQVAIVLDGLVVSSPRIDEAIPNGIARITGGFSQLEAQDLANKLNYGALPLAFDRGEVQLVSPTLGANQLNAGLLAGALGLLLVVVFTLLYYRVLGFVTVGSLAVAGGMLYLLFLLLGKWIGFTLTLAGIAGAIVAIGVTADSFIVYFERVRDEMREGRTLRTAVETGWVRARRTILIADFVSLIAAFVLYLTAVGGVKGFAFTLGLTTIIDLIVIFVFTKPALIIISRLNFFVSGHRLSGFSRKSLGMPMTKEA